MASYTFAEAAELTGLTKKALRNRVYRGQLAATLDGQVRRIPQAELERAGLLPTTAPVAAARARPTMPHPPFQRPQRPIRRGIPGRARLRYPATWAGVRWTGGRSPQTCWTGSSSVPR